MLVFDAGDLVYVTDAREDDRTTLDFVLESTEPMACRCTFLAHDGTPTDIAPATEKSAEGWRRRFVMFPGSSLLIDARKR